MMIIADKTQVARLWHRIAAFVSPAEPPRKGPRLSLDTQLAGLRVVLRTGDPANWRNWRMMRDISRGFLVPWEPRWPGNALTYAYFCSLLRRQWRDWRQGKGYAFLIFLRGKNGEADVVIGGITLGEVHRGISQKGTLGYWIGEPYAGRGYMTEAAELVCDFALNKLKLHRIEASCMPNNEPSKHLLRRLGFAEEGYAKDYLQINGIWQDHLLWGRTNEKTHNSR